jgi:GNAT superfamily N-acetyltransferase
MKNNVNVLLLPIKESSDKNLEYHLEYMRKIRNSCKDYMTRFRGEITPEMQKKWYENISENLNPYIFIACEYGVIFYPFGYGMISYEDDRALLTGAIDEQYRGKGFGRILFDKLIEISKKKTDKVFLEVLDNNVVAKKLYKSIGFEIVDQKNNVITMELKK